MVFFIPNRIKTYLCGTKNGKEIRYRILDCRQMGVWVLKVSITWTVPRIWGQLISNWFKFIPWGCSKEPLISFGSEVCLFFFRFGCVWLFVWWFGYVLVILQFGHETSVPPTLFPGLFTQESGKDQKRPWHRLVGSSFWLAGWNVIINVIFMRMLWNWISYSKWRTVRRRRQVEKIFSKAVNNLDGSQFTAATLNMSVHANLFLGVFWVIRPAYARAFSRPSHFLREKTWWRGCRTSGGVWVRAL